jgi:hypothetical protein
MIMMNYTWYQVTAAEREGKKRGDIVPIEVTAPGYAKWHMILRFKKAGFMKFPVELEREVEGIGKICCVNLIGYTKEMKYCCSLHIAC